LALGYEVMDVREEGDEGESSRVESVWSCVMGIGMAAVTCD
jgi:hypothetical protein